MADVMIVRADDHLVVGVRWSGFTVVGTGAGTRLSAGQGARLMLLLPPQHVAEQTSPPDQPRPPGTEGQPIPVWRGRLSGPSRITVKIPAGTEIPLTAKGVLAAADDAPVVVPPGVPDADDTVIELPYRLLVAPAPRGARDLTAGVGAEVVCRHSVDASTGANGLWRTRLVDGSQPPSETLLDAHLELTVADKTVAAQDDPDFGPGNPIPLTKGDRVRLHLETTLNGVPARLDRLELSTLGGSLDGTGDFQNFRWRHKTTLGRDMYVHKEFVGALYPLGHRAVLQEIIERRYDDASAGGAAVLRRTAMITVLDPVREPPTDGRVRRAFPMGTVEITRTVFTGLARVDWQFKVWPGIGSQPTFAEPHVLGPNGASVPLLFPVRCRTETHDVELELPLLFVADLRGANGGGVDSLASRELATELAGAYGRADVSIPPTDIDLVGAPPTPAVRELTDVYEVRALTIAGNKAADLADGYRAQLDQLEIALPAMRSLLGEDPIAEVSFDSDYLDLGPSAPILLEMSEVGIDFAKKADRSGGLLAPSYVTNAISRQYGPILKDAMDAATGAFDPATLFPSDDATLLGFPLRDLIATLDDAPEITATPSSDPGGMPNTRMRWKGIQLESSGPFQATPSSKLDLDITAGPDGSSTTCVVTDFTLQLPPGDGAVLELTFATMTFDQTGGKSPSVEVDGVTPSFTGDLSLIETLTEALDLGEAGKYLDVQPTGLTVKYALPVPAIPSSGVFVMSNIVFNGAIRVPFTGDPVSITLGFSSRANPFQLAVTMFGGTGYLELELNKDGIRRFEAALEFGAFVKMDFVVATGEVHVLGGVRFELTEGEVTITGYLRIGGSIEVLGLISVSIELILSLAYRSEDKSLVGRATLVIEVDLTLWSESVEIDSGEYKFIGGGDSDGPPSARSASLEAWKLYRSAFADLGVEA